MHMRLSSTSKRVCFLLALRSLTPLRSGENMSFALQAIDHVYRPNLAVPSTLFGRGVIAAVCVARRGGTNKQKSQPTPVVMTFFHANPKNIVTLPPTNMASEGWYLEDQFPLGGTPCQVPC